MTHTIREIAAALGAEAEGDLDLRVIGAAEPARRGPTIWPWRWTREIRRRAGAGPGAGGDPVAGGRLARDGACAAAIFAPRPRLAMAGLTRLMDPGPASRPACIRWPWWTRRP
jgi:UDP-3-O-[3-hydroxymyristoyl] glucosamine N-acyltransferase